MLRDNPYFQQDLDRLIGNSVVPWRELTGRTVLITGATGLIGYTLSSALLQYNLTCNGETRIMMLVRNRKRAEEKFADWLCAGAAIAFIEGTVEDLPDIPGSVDYIIHCACPTDSRYLTDHPTATIDTIYTGTKSVLKLAREKRSQGVVNLSSMEVYGEVRTQEQLRETDLGYIDLSSPRSSYPEGKRLAENLCCAYAKEYEVPVTTARLAQTIGPGVNRGDKRIFAYMARCALEGKDILLNTDGSKKCMYLYTMDAVSAILLLLVKGERGTAYNAANEGTYCSIKEMAELVAETLGNGLAAVRTNVCREDRKIYSPAQYLRLDTIKLSALGWRPSVDLRSMYVRMINAF